MVCKKRSLNNTIDIVADEITVEDLTVTGSFNAPSLINPSSIAPGTVDQTEFGKLNGRQGDLVDTGTQGQVITSKKTMGDDLIIDGNNGKLIRFRTDFPTFDIHSILYRGVGSECICNLTSDVPIDTAFSVGYFTGNNRANAYNDKFNITTNNSTTTKIKLDGQNIFQDNTTLSSGVVNSSLQRTSGNLSIGNLSTSSILTLNSTNNSTLNFGYQNYFFEQSGTGNLQIRSNVGAVPYFTANSTAKTFAMGNNANILNDVVLNVDGNGAGALKLPDHTTTQRNALTGLDGMMLYNTTDNGIQFRANNTWFQVAGFNPGQGDLMQEGGSHDINGTHNFNDNSFFIVDDVDSTKKARFECSGISTASTRIYTLPDGDTTLLSSNLQQTTTNKSFDDTTCLFQNTADTSKKLQLNLSNLASGTKTLIIPPINSDTMCTLSAVQTLTGKTITNPVIGDIRGVLDVVNVKNSLGNVTNLEINNTGVNVPSGSTYKINNVDINLASKSNSTATDPGLTDDSNSGYSVGSLWTNTTTRHYFICLDNTPGAARWHDNCVKSISINDFSTNSTTYVTAANWVIQDGQPLNNFFIIITPTNQCDVRIFVPGTVSTLGELLNITAGPIQGQTINVTSPPQYLTGNQTLQLQIRRSGGGGGNCTINTCEMN